MTILKFLKKCQSNQESQINEAIFIKSQVPSLNKNLFNKGSLYTLKVYQWFVGLVIDCNYVF